MRATVMALPRGESMGTGDTRTTHGLMGCCRLLGRTVRRNCFPLTLDACRGKADSTVRDDDRVSRAEDLTRRAPRPARGAHTMKMADISFGTTDWSQVERTEHKGETGTAYWRTKHFADVRVRMVEYTPGYLADHWCAKGHLLLCLEGELHTELQDGRT